MTRDELREKMITIMRESVYCTHGQVADQILDLPEIKRGLELVRIAEAIATRKEGMGNDQR
jgi:hypothetical protein